MSDLNRILSLINFFKQLFKINKLPSLLRIFKHIGYIRILIYFKLRFNFNIYSKILNDSVKYK